MSIERAVELGYSYFVGVNKNTQQDESLTDASFKPVLHGVFGATGAQGSS